ncbi:uncharacterized protein LOC134813087 [Bolinopsis microptera]|uniref:uncharacterized protein LOC134813087 n=1 Tax=Bolinopsis microptera TaxID=2820187 RepID=UPI0030795C2D
MSDDDGPPPLDDMSEFVKKLSGNQVQFDKVQVSQQISATEARAENQTTGIVLKADKPCKTEPSKCNNANVGYGGMKKGFLSGGLSNPRKRERKEVKITEVKANPQAKQDGLKLKEVQAKMSEANQFLSDNSNDWLSDDLLKGIQTNDKINSKLSNPQFMAAFQEFQTNPQEAAKKYGNNTEMKKFIQEFSGLMGNHFTGLAEKQDGAK